MGKQGTRLTPIEAPRSLAGDAADRIREEILAGGFRPGDHLVEAKIADQLSISGVNRQVQDLAARARANKLRLEDIQGGTFTVNNTGWFGSVTSMPIINAPEVAILSMEAIVKRPVVIEVDGADVIAIRPMMNMTCSFDHRVLDGAQVGYFLADIRKRLEAWDFNTPIG